MRHILATLVFVTLASAAYGATQFTPAESWKKEQPASRFRSAQYLVPAAQGDSGPTRVVVFTFPGGAGGVEANLARWRGQVSQGKGDPAPKQEKRTFGSFPATVLDLTGTYTPTSFNPMNTPTPQPNMRVINVVLETPDGLVFVKLTGPKATVGTAEKDFFRFLESVRDDK